MTKLFDIEIYKNGDVELVIVFTKSPGYDHDIIGMKTWCEFLQDWVFVDVRNLKGNHYNKLKDLFDKTLEELG